MNIRRNLIGAGLCLAGLAALALFTAPKLRAGVTGTLVELIAPTRPYSNGTNAPYGEIRTFGTAQYYGANSGSMAMSSLTLTNTSTIARQVLIGQAYFSGSLSCGYNSTASGSPISVTMPAFTVMVPAQSTVHMPFPTPVVYSTGCMVAQNLTSGAGSVQVTATGFAN